MNRKYIILPLLLLATLLTACGGKEERREAAPVRVTTETLGSNPQECGRTYVGEVEAQSSTAVSFVGMGTVLRIHVAEGQHVRKGQLIAEMDDTQARNTLATCEAQKRQADDAYERMRLLYEQQALPDIKWVEVQSQVAQAQAALDIARKAVADCRIYAPVSGVVGKKLMNAGETALPSQPVCTILDLSTVKVKASIPEKEIGTFSATTPTDIYVAALDAHFTGGTVEKGVEADPVSRTYEVRIRVDNASGRLMDGMVCDVKVRNADALARTRQALLTVPIKAVQQATDGSKFVWKAVGGKAHRAKVSTGATLGNRIAVTGEVRSGDKVIVSGYQKLNEGSHYEE